MNEIGMSNSKSVHKITPGGTTTRKMASDVIKGGGDSCIGLEDIARKREGGSK